jgi:hypothetical protein
MIERVQVVEWALQVCEAAWLERDHRLVREMGGCQEARRGIQVGMHAETTSESDLALLRECWVGGGVGEGALANHRKGGRTGVC